MTEFSRAEIAQISEIVRSIIRDEITAYIQQASIHPQQIRPVTDAAQQAEWDDPEAANGYVLTYDETEKIVRFRAP